jgi:Holliday junction resolvase
MNDPEKAFERNLIAALEKRGAFAHHFDAVGCDGWPDLVVLKDDRCALVECKYNTVTLRKDQAAFRILLADRYNFRKVITAAKLKSGFQTIFHVGDEDNSETWRTVEQVAGSILRMMGE